MILTTKQLNKLGDYLLDIPKLVAGIYVFTSLPNKPLQFILGSLSAIAFLIAGIHLSKEEKQ